MSGVEWYRATGPDGEIAFSMRQDDSRPLAVVARLALAAKRGVDPRFLAATFTQIVPTSAAARAVVPPPL